MRRLVTRNERQSQLIHIAAIAGIAGATGRAAMAGAMYVTALTQGAETPIIGAWGTPVVAVIVVEL
jgi:hypothetical protein